MDKTTPQDYDSNCGLPTPLSFSSDNHDDIHNGTNREGLHALSCTPSVHGKVVDRSRPESEARRNCMCRQTVT